MNETMVEEKKKSDLEVLEKTSNISLDNIKRTGGRLLSLFQNMRNIPLSEESKDVIEPESKNRIIKVSNNLDKMNTEINKMDEIILQLEDMLK